MKKILSLGPEQWMSGISQGYFYENGGIWATALGLNPFVDAERSNNQVGLLRAGPTLTSGGTVTGTPCGWCSDLKSDGNQRLYFNAVDGANGKIYELNTSSDTGLTSLRTVADLANGITVYQAPQGSGGATTKYLYYWQKTKIGRVDIDAVTPTYTDNYIGSGGTINTALQDTVNHPVHRFRDQIYYGNKDRIGRITDDGAGAISHSDNVLDFEQNYLCTTLADDGTYLVVGITKNSSGSANTYPGTKIVFWDTASSSWTREWDLRDSPGILSIRNVGGMLYALSIDGLYVFNFSTPPRRVYNLAADASDTVGISSVTGSHYSMDVLGEGVIWGSPTRLHYYGRYLGGVPVAYHQPLSASASTRMVAASAKTQRIYAGTTTPTFGYYDLSNLGTPATGVAGESRFIDLKDKYTIGQIDVVFGATLASGDSLNIGVATQAGQAITDFGGTNAITFAGLGAVDSATLYGSISGDHLLIKPTFAGGAVKIKRIDIYGERIKR